MISAGEPVFYEECAEMRHGVDAVRRDGFEYRAVDKVDFDDVIVVFGCEVANRLGFADLARTSDYERLSAVQFLPFFKENVDFASEIHIFSMISYKVYQKQYSWATLFVANYYSKATLFVANQIGIVTLFVANAEGISSLFPLPPFPP